MQVHMWQSWIELEYYSVVISSTSLSLKCYSAHMHFVDVSDIHAFT